MKMTIPCAVAFVLLAGCDGFNGARARADLYVSPRGSDAAAGVSPFSPLRTLARARDVARARGSTTTIALADGVY